MADNTDPLWTAAEREAAIAHPEAFDSAVLNRKADRTVARLIEALEQAQHEMVINDDDPNVEEIDRHWDERKQLLDSLR